MKYNPDQILDFIIDYKKENDGNSPSIREIMESCGVSSTSVVVNILHNLEADEKITFSGNGKTRQIKVTGGQWIYTPDFTEAHRTPNPDHNKEAIIQQYERIWEH